jgi:hypothetical protein
MMLPIFLGPRNSVRSLATGLLASFCAAQAGCGLIGDDGVACTAVSVESLVGTVRDEAGNPLPVYDVQARVGWRTFVSCYGKLGGFSCRDLPAGEATVTTRTQGQELTGSVQLSWAAGEEGCHTASAELALVKPGASCPALESLSERSALSGSVRDSRGAPVSLGSVLIVPSDDSGPSIPAPQSCTTESNRFDCPAATPYSQLYQLSVGVPGGILKREVYVPASECEIDAQNVELMSPDACPERRVPAIEVAVSRADGKSAFGVSVSEVRAAWEDTPSYACSFSASSEAAQLYRCDGRHDGRGALRHRGVGAGRAVHARSRCERGRLSARNATRHHRSSLS